MRKTSSWSGLLIVESAWHALHHAELTKDRISAGGRRTDGMT